MQDILDTAFRISLPKGQRHSLISLLPGGKCQEGGGVLLLHPVSQPSDHCLVAGLLHVTPAEMESRPHQGIEPVKHESQPGQRPDHRIPPADMDFFMQENIPFLLKRQTLRQINPGPENAIDKGRPFSREPADLVSSLSPSRLFVFCRLCRPFFPRARSFQPSVQPYQGSRTVNQKRRYAQNPDPRRQI